MRNALVAGCVAAALGLGLPGVAFGQPPTQDALLGTASVDQDGAFAFTFDVRSGPSGENPTGRVSVRLSPGGPVVTSKSISCLVVHDGTAIVAGSLLPNPVGYTDFVVTVEDAGPAGPVPDRMGAAITTGATTSCDASNLVRLPVITGDVVVTDARPLPQTKDQCKGGGWRTYGVFKNQGDCVSSVATGRAPGARVAGAP